MSQNIIFTNRPDEAIENTLNTMDYAGIWILADTNTMVMARSLQSICPSLSDAKTIEIEAGDNHKSLTQLSHVWQHLSEEGASRHSLLINIGGGMVTDLGGFAAATFKRGIRFINIPTTLLGAVDAAVGGKTGINFAGLKNEIGAFAPAHTVVISTNWFSTLPHDELTSGYAEMLKHALIDSQEALGKALSFNIDTPDFHALLPLLEHSVNVKRRIVTEDPHENGIRKALNLGHTAAHAFEALAMERNRPVAHGHAVAWGLVVDLVLSHMQLQFPADTLRAVAAFVERHYPAPEIKCPDYEHLIDLMRHDKKNIDRNHINFTLLRAPGKVVIDRTATPDDISTALDILRDLLHI